jgi:hypothetical protein
MQYVVTSPNVFPFTDSKSDASVHIAENPYLPQAWHGHEVAITLILLVLLGAVFLLGFSEAVSIAIPLVVVFLALNAAIIAVGIVEVITTPGACATWTDALSDGGGLIADFIGRTFMAFPLLVLRLSGFETGVSMMPLVAADGADEQQQQLRSRIRNPRKLLTVAAVIMSGYLLAASFVTTVLIPAEQFRPGGDANGRALAYIAHEYLGEASAPPTTSAPS